MRIVAAVPSISLLAGCAIGAAYPDVPFAFLIGVFVLSAAAALWSAGRAGERALLVCAAVAFASGGALLGAQAWQHAWRSSLRIAFESIAHDQRERNLRPDSDRILEDSASVVIVGRLRSDAVLSASGVSLDVDVEWIGRSGRSALPDGGAANPVSGRVLVTVPGELATRFAPEWRAGRQLSLVAQVHRPARYLDPGVPDQERVLARRGITLVGSAKSGALVTIVARGSRREEWAAAARAFARRAIGDAVGRWSRRSAGIVTAIVIGDRSGLDPEVERSLQDAGTYHVIAISGGNIAILAGVVLALFRVGGVLGRAAMIAAMALLLVYGGIVGGSASVDRATFMATIYLLGRALDLRGPPFNALAIVAGLLALMNPLAVADPGFLLTFGATLAILIVTHVTVPPGHGAIASIAGLLRASLAAEVALFPVAAAFFARVTFAGLALNFAAIPAMAVAQLAGMLVVLCAFIAPLAAAIGYVAHVGAEALVRSSQLVDYAPLVTWRVVAPSAVPITLYYAATATVVSLWYRRRTTTGSRERPAARRIRLGALAAAMGAAVWILWPPAFRFRTGDGTLRVTFLDVGQGDAAFVRLPHGSALVVDTGGLPGGGFDIGDRVVAPLLRQQGIGRLDALVLTHGDRDHVGGAAALLREFRPRDVWEGIPVPRLLTVRQLRTALEQGRSRWTEVRRDDAMSIDGVHLTVHHPRPPDWERQETRNEDSVVFELRWRDTSFVFTGDIGAETEQAIAARFTPAPLRVLKVPHHGSATSSTEPFVRALAPAIAVISVGRNNTYGHPSKTVVDRYRSIGSEIFRTDRDGAITITTDGVELNVMTFVGTTTHFPLMRHENTKARK